MKTLISGSHQRLNMKLLLGLALLAGLPMAYLQFVEKYIFNDWDMAGTMLILMLLDTLTGMGYAWKTGVIQSGKLRRIAVKVLCFGGALLVVHQLSHSLVRGEPNAVMGFIMPYADSILYAGIMLREVLSINENMGKMGYPFLPVFITKRIYDFNERGEYVPGYNSAPAQPANPPVTP